MKPFLVDVPVLILFFNRPQQLSQVFEQVRNARPSKLFLYQDGPRSEHDLPGIKACREVTDQIDWDCEVHRMYQEKNYGCDPSEYISQKWAFSMVDKCIVLEDDDVPSVSFQDLLQGNATGVQFTSASGQPGSSASLSIRGMGSFNASNSPLYVIDGVPVTSGSINSISSDGGVQRAFHREAHRHRHGVEILRAGAHEDSRLIARERHGFHLLEGVVDFLRAEGRREVRFRRGFAVLHAQGQPVLLHNAQLAERLVEVAQHAFGHALLKVVGRFHTDGGFAAAAFGRHRVLHVAVIVWCEIAPTLRL